MQNDTDLRSEFTTQLERGFRWLRFSPALEHQYRAHHLETVRTTVVACSGLLIILSAVLTLRHQGVTTESVPTPDLISQLRVWVLRPLSLLLLLFAFVPALFRRAWLIFTPPALAVMGAIGSVSVAHKVAAGNTDAFVSMVTGLFGVYLLTGMLFWQLAAVGAMLVAFYWIVLTELAVEPATIAFEGGVMLALTVLACVFCYNLEWTRRKSWLQQRILTQLGRRDALTGLKNRRAFDDTLGKLWRQGLRDNQPLGMLLLDVDHFKKYNDRYGHQAGDKCLAKIGEYLSSIGERPFDLAARIGGEEFALLFYGCGQEHLAAAARQVLEGVAALEIPHDASSTADTVTVSIGGAHVQPQINRTPEGLQQFCDESLYQAKENGRNQVVIREDMAYADLVTGRFATVKRPSNP